jgi:hypothetical protein
MLILGEERLRLVLESVCDYAIFMLETDGARSKLTTFLCRT